MQHDSGSEINHVQTITTESCPKSQHMHPAKDHDSCLLTNTKQIISNITNELQQQIQKQTELLNTKEKYERDIKELKSENARLLEKRIQKQLETHERNIEALSSIQSPRGEFIQTESQNTDQSCTPKVKKTVGLKKTIKTLEIEKNERDSMITALKEQLYSHSEQKERLLNQILRTKKEVSLTKKLKSDIKKLSNRNKNLKQKIRQVKKEQSSATKIRVKKLKETIQVTVKKLELDLHHERNTVIHQRNQIKELERQVQLLLKHSSISPTPTETKESPKIKKDDKKRSRRRSSDVSSDSDILELESGAMGPNKLILPNCQKKNPDSSASSPSSWQLNRALGLGLDVKLTTNKQYRYGSTKGKICRSPTISHQNPNKTWQNARAMGLGNVGLFGTLGALSPNPTVHRQKSPPSILSSLAPSINSQNSLSSIQSTKKGLNPLLKMMPSGYP